MAATMALRGSRIAFLAAEDQTESDLLGSIRLLKQSGARVDLIGSRSAEIPLFRRHSDGVTERVCVPAHRKLLDIDPAEYGAVAVPGTLLEDGCLRLDSDVHAFIGKMLAAGKMILCLPAPGGASSDAAASSGDFNWKRLMADSWQNWNAINAPRLGAALAFYSVLSMAPLLVLTVAIAGLVFRRDLVQTDLLLQVRELMGPQIAELFRAVLQNARLSTGVIAGALSLIILLVSSSGVFLELRDSLDTVWGVKPHYGTGILSLVRERAFAFLLTLGTGLALLIMFLLSTILATPARFFLGLLHTQGTLLTLCAVGISFIVMSVVFALIYKVIPDIFIPLSDVWIGALVTSALFTTGRLLIGLYLSKAAVGSTYAAAASLIVFLTWVYYSAQIFLFGAEFTHVYALRHGSYSDVSSHGESD